MGRLINNMKEVQLYGLKDGMVLAEPVRTKYGQLIADKGVVLNSQHIGRFTFYHISSVMIESDDEKKEEKKESRKSNKKEKLSISDANVNSVIKSTVKIPEAAMPDPQVNITSQSTVEIADLRTPKVRTFQDDHVSFSQKIGQSQEFQDFQLSYSFSIEELKNNFDLIKSGEMTPTYKSILTNSGKLLEHRTPLETFNMIRSTRGNSDSIYAHCINVALISRILGKWLKFSNDDLDELTLAGFLHDIGKICVDPEILNKPSRLTPDELLEVQNHTVYGHKILKNTNVSSRVRTVALQHHERFDESGYPRSLPGDEIEDFAALVGIADVYDGMTAIRPYRAPLCAFQVIEEFERDGYQKYNPQFMMTFLSHIAAMHNNSHVMLSDGRTVRIVYINRANLSSPIVETETGQMLDLSAEPALSIIKTL